jgi:hypothetical protein
MSNMWLRSIFGCIILKLALCFTGGALEEEMSAQADHSNGADGREIDENQRPKTVRSFSFVDVLKYKLFNCDLLAVI